MNKPGTVYITGAGPGDPGLITLKAIKELQKADVVVYDHLVNTELLKHCPKETRMFYAGKRPGNHTLTQAEINQLLIDESKKGHLVVRLKGGDPFIFGRGAEEALDLRRAGISYEITPGISAGNAAPAYAGIPLTYRGLSSSVVFVTGHEDPEKTVSSVDWENLSRLHSTLVLYMGLGNLNRISSLLQDYGAPGDTPASMIQWGTLQKQTILHSTLANISGMARQENISPPVITVIGEVASLGRDLDWFIKGPLSGKTIIVTRSSDQVSSLSSRLTELGAEVNEIPAIEIRRIPDFSEIDRNIDQISNFSWVFFTSVNSVNFFFKRIIERGSDSRLLGGINISAIGKATSEALGKYGITPDLVPDAFNSLAMSEKLRTMGNRFSGQHILLPGSSISGRQILETLESLGAHVRKLDLYQNIPIKYNSVDIPDFSSRKEIIVTFTSASTVTNFVDILRNCGLENQIKKISGYSIGPATSKKANELGVRIVAESNPHTIEALTETIVYHLKEQKHDIPDYKT